MVAVDAVIGYLHRCHEKLAETLTYVQYPSHRLQDRLRRGHDRRSWPTSRAVEKVGEDRGAPARAVSAGDRRRAAADRLPLPLARDVVHGHGRRPRRRRDHLPLLPSASARLILDLFEALTGARLLYGFHQIGGVRYDLPPGWAEQVRETLKVIEAAPRRVRGHARGQHLLPRAHPGRRRDLARARPGRWASAGPLIRGSGVDYDVRRAEPYSSYGDFELQGSGGDGRRLLRALPRADGRVPASRSGSCARPSTGCPEGPISSRPGVKSVGQVRVPKGEGYARVEGARGEVGCYLVRRRRAQAVPPQVARRVVLEPVRPAAHHPRPQGGRRGGDHGLGRPRVRRGRP